MYIIGRTNAEADAGVHVIGPVWAPELSSISPSCFLAECCKRQLNLGRFVLLYLVLSVFGVVMYLVCVFSCTVSFVSISQVTGCEDCLQNETRLYAVLHNSMHVIGSRVDQADETIVCDWLLAEVDNGCSACDNVHIAVQISSKLQYCVQSHISVHLNVSHVVGCSIS